MNPHDADHDRHARIVVGYDGSDGARHALTWAAEEATARGASLRVVQVVHRLEPRELAWLAEAGVSPAVIREQAEEGARRSVANARTRLRDSHPELPVSTDNPVGDPRTVLIEEGRHADLVVVGSRGHGPVASVFLGSVGTALVRHAETPVAVVRPAAAGSTKRVIVGIGTTEASETLLRAAAHEATVRQVPFTVVSCAWSAAETDEWYDVPIDDVYTADRAALVERALARIRMDFPTVRITVRLTRGRADRCLIDIAGEDDLLVLGRRTTSVLDHIGLGSMSSVVVEHARGAVIVVPTPARHREG